MAQVVQDGAAGSPVARAQVQQTVQAALHGLQGQPHVIDVRNFGLVAGIELAPIPGQPGARGQAIFRAMFESGLLVRVTGDIIALSPPLIVSAAQIDEIASRLAEGLARLD
jgi:beta-alanine--pyruvate transaminase